MMSIIHRIMSHYMAKGILQIPWRFLISWSHWLVAEDEVRDIWSIRRTLHPSGQGGGDSCEKKCEKPPVTAIRETGASSYTLKELNSANSLNDLAEGFSAEPSEPRLINTLIWALWNSKEKTQMIPSEPLTYKTEVINECCWSHWICGDVFIQGRENKNTLIFHLIDTRCLVASLLSGLICIFFSPLEIRLEVKITFLNGG